MQKVSLRIKSENMVLDNLVSELEDVVVPMSSVDVGKYARHPELSCDVLTSLYCDDDVSVSCIADTFHCTIPSIYAKMRKCNISRRYCVSTDFVFNDIQKQVLEGCMLGDGHLQWTGNNCYFSNSDNHGEYHVWLQEKLGIVDISKISLRTRELRTRCISSLRDEYKRWYPNGSGTVSSPSHKVVPKDIELTLIKVLFWYIGDGTYETVWGGSIFTSRLNLDVATLLVTQLQDVLTVNAGITMIKGGKNTDDVQCYRIRLSRPVANKFFALVDSLNFDIPECYMYKFGKDV